MQFLSATLNSPIGTSAIGYHLARARFGLPYAQMAGNDERNAVMSDSFSHGLRRHPLNAPFLGNPLGKGFVGCRTAVWNLQQQLPHIQTKMAIYQP